MRTLRNISSSRIGIAGLAFAFSMRAGMDRICDQGAGPMVSGGHDEADGAAKVAPPRASNLMRQASAARTQWLSNMERPGRAWRREHGTRLRAVAAVAKILNGRGERTDGGVSAATATKSASKGSKATLCGVVSVTVLCAEREGSAVF